MSKRSEDDSSLEEVGSIEIGEEVRFKVAGLETFGELLNREGEYLYIRPYSILGLEVHADENQNVWIHSGEVVTGKASFEEEDSR